MTSASPHTAYKTFVPSTNPIAHLQKQHQYAQPPATSTSHSDFNPFGQKSKEDSSSSSSHISSIPKFISKFADSNTTPATTTPFRGGGSYHRTQPTNPNPVSISSNYTYHSRSSTRSSWCCSPKRKFKEMTRCAWAPCVFLPSNSSKMACGGSIILLILAFFCLVITVLAKFQLTQLESYFWVFLVAAASCLGAALLTWNVMTICKWRQQGRYNQELFEESLD